MTQIANASTLPLAGFTPEHFSLSVSGKVATVMLNRPEKKNPLTFASYRELTDFFLAAQKEEEVKAIVVTGAGGRKAMKERAPMVISGAVSPIAREMPMITPVSTPGMAAGST